MLQNVNLDNKDVPRSGMACLCRVSTSRGAVLDVEPLGTGKPCRYGVWSDLSIMHDCINVYSYAKLYVRICIAEPVIAMLSFLRFFQEGTKQCPMIWENITSGSATMTWSIRASRSRMCPSGVNW